MIWWTLARDTNSDNIVKVILPEVSTKVILPEVGSCQLLHNEAEGQAIVAAFNCICCEPGVNFLYFCAANAVARLGIFQKYQDWDGRFEGVLNKKWQRIIDVQCHTVIR